MEKRRTAVLDGYFSILAHTERMLTSAHAEAWEDLIAQESDYLIEVERLRLLEDKTPLDVNRSEVKREVLAKILENDQQVRAILQDRLVELSGIMEQTRRKQRVNQAYNVSGFALPDKFQ